MAIETLSPISLPYGTLSSRTAASVQNPDVGKVVFFIDSANGHLSQKDSSGTVVDLASSSVSATGLIVDAPASNSVPTPSANTVNIYGSQDAGYGRIFIENSNGTILTPQGALWLGEISYWKAVGNSTVLTNFGFSTASTGTITARNVSATSFATRLKRVAYVGTTTAGSIVELRHQFAQWTVGTGTQNIGGFFLSMRFVNSNGVNIPDERSFIGMGAAAAFTNAEPSSLLNSIGVAKLSTSNNFHIVYGGSTAQAPINLGADFPANTLSTDAYDLKLFSPSNSNNTVYYEVVRLGTTFVASGILTGTAGVALPSSTTFITPKFAKTNNTTTQIPSIDPSHIYIGREL